MKRAILVNGVPASGKSTVAAVVSTRLRWFRLTLDTVKEPFFDELGVGDRDFNRALGRASYAAIWSLVADAPGDMGVVVDAWHGFQPREVLDMHLARAGVVATAELWCHAPPQVLAGRYRARIGSRHAGHPGEAFVPELIALAGRAKPLDRGPRLDIDTTMPLDADAVMAWLSATLGL